MSETIETADGDLVTVALGRVETDGRARRVRLEVTSADGQQAIAYLTPADVLLLAAALIDRVKP